MYRVWCAIRKHEIQGLFSELERFNSVVNGNL